MAKKKKRAELEAGEKLEEGRNLKEREKHDLDNNVDLVSGEPNKKKNKKKHKRDKTGTDEVGYESPTVSIALPGSIIDNTQSLELATRLAGQVARAATIFRIDEVVVFDNKNSSENDSGVTTLVSSDENESGAAFLIRILQYLETPQYLRKALFPKHNNLRFVGMLPPLDAPHHLRKHEWAAYREGVTLKEKAPNSMRTMVDVGLSKNVVVEQTLEPAKQSQASFPPAIMATQPLSSETGPSSSIFSGNSRIPEDTVFFSIFPDSSLSTSSTITTDISSSLQTLHLGILNSISPFTSSYIWQHEPFSLSISFSSCVCCSSSSSPLPHLHGKLRFGDNLEDEWFTVFLLFHVSNAFPSLSIRVWDGDGEFLLIESAFHLPRWVNPDNSRNRVFIRGGDLHIIPRHLLPEPTLVDSLLFLVEHADKCRASDPVQAAVKNRISEYPERASRNMHSVRVRVPVSVALVLRHEPCFISLAVEGFYDRDIDSMRFAARMERFLSEGKRENLVRVTVRMSRAMYAQLVQQTFQAPKCYRMPNRSDAEAYMEAELGMKIACGLEMIYQQRKKEGVEGKGSTWRKYKESLERSGYFEGLIPGSKEYKRLMENAEEYYRNSSLFSRTSEMMSAPVKRIDEILALPHSVDDFKGLEVPPSDDDSWLYNGEDELNSALQERQKEMELYNAKLKKKQKSKEPQDAGTSSHTNINDFDLGEIAKSMQQFVQKVSSYKGAEVPEDRNLEEVDLDVDRFMKDMESIMKQHGHQDTAVAHGEEGLSSEMDFDDSEDESDLGDTSEDNDDAEDVFMHSYSDVMNEELKNTTLKKSFLRASEQSSKENLGASSAMDEDFTPVDVDFNLVKGLLDSFSSQQGLPGPTSNLLGLMGVQLPKDGKKSN